MKKILIIALLITNSLAANAHSPQISTIVLTQSKDNHWNLLIGCSLSAFHYELKNSYPNKKTDSLNAVDFQKLIVQYLKEKIKISGNGKKTASLTNGMVILGHQTDVRFDIIGMPDELRSLDLKQLSFATVNGHYCLLKIIAKGNSSGSFMLQKNNDFAISLALKNNALVEIPKTNKPNWLLIGVISCVLGFGLLYKRFLA